MREKLLRRAGLSQMDLLACLGIAGAAFLLGGARVAGVFAPFCLAFCTAAPLRFCLPAALGGLAGTLLLSGSNGAVYAAALIISAAVRLLFHPKHPAWGAVLAGGSLALVYLFSIMMAPVGGATWLLYGAEAMLCGSLSFLFQSALHGWDKPRRNAAEISGLGVLAISLLLSLCLLAAGGFSLGRFAAALLTAEAALLWGASGGATAGLLCSIALALYTKDFALAGGILAVAGFVSGVFRPVGRVVQTALFAGICILCAAFLGGLPMQALAEMAAAGVAAALIPERLFARLAGKTHAPPKPDGRLTDELSMKLQFTARTLLDLQENVEECARRMDGAAAGDLNNIYRNTADGVCRRCGLNTFCWVTSYNDMMRALADVTTVLRQNGGIHDEQAPPFLKQKCCRLPQFLQSVNLGYRDFLSKEQAARRVNEARAIATEQFSGMSDLLLEMSAELADVARVDDEGAAAVRNLMRDRGIDGAGVSCLLDRFDRMTIDLYLDEQPAHADLISLTETISDNLDREFAPPSCMKSGERVKISFFEQATLRVQFAAAQAARGGGSCCGDSYETFMDSKGFAHMILSDGMGSGSRAALDSVMTCSTMRRLLQTGFGFGSAFKLMNLSFAVKSNDESLATVDTCTVDLYTGHTRFIKAGAASSFVRKNGRVTELTSSSLPIGIIQGVPYDSEEVRLGKGDWIVLVTDGATSSGSGWIAEEIKLLSGRPPKQLAESLLNSARQRAPEGQEDDITVLVCKIF